MQSKATKSADTTIAPTVSQAVINTKKSQVRTFLDTRCGTRHGDHTMLPLSQHR